MWYQKIFHFFSRNWHHIMVLMICIVLTCLFYGPSIGLGFFSDDWSQILEAAHHSGSVLNYFWNTIDGTRGGGSYGPLFNLLMTVQWAVFGWYAPMYHVVSLVLYAATALAIFIFSKNITSRFDVGLLAMIIFLILPSHTEAVVWVAVQPHLLSTLIFIVALIVYHTAIGRGAFWYRYISLGLIVLSLLTKEITLPFLGIFFLMDWCLDKHDARDRVWWRKYLMFVAVCIVTIGGYWWVRHIITGSGLGYYGQTSLALSVYHMKRMAIEMSLTLLLPWPYRHSIMLWLFDYRPILYIIFFVFVYLIYFFSKRERVLMWACLSYILSLVPFLPLLLSPWNNEGERYTYLPSVFVALVLAIILNMVREKLRLSIVGFLFCIGLLVSCGLAVQRIKLMPWLMAQSVTNSILGSVASVDVRPHDYVVAIGLPDNVAGAQVFRNAIKEAVTQSRRAFFSLERVPIYTALEVKQAQTVSFSFTPVSTTMYRLSSTEFPSSSMFTGFATVTSTIGKVTLEGWQRGDVGRSVLLRLDNKKIDLVLQEYERVVVIYYSRGVLRSAVIRTRV
jgi:hypothetical protein